MVKRSARDADGGDVGEGRTSKQARRDDDHAPSDDDEDMGDASGGERSQDASDDDGENDDDEESPDEGGRAPDHSVVNEKGLACSGVLESVTVHNFMCHKNLVFKLGRNVNVINGPNGSGKSAIVAAVQIGLGARSSATERAARLDDHIMYGENAATITIRIRNEINEREVEFARADEGDGDEDEDEVDDGKSRSNRSSGDSSTYKHDIYGNAIEIQRILKRGGANQWNVRNYRRTNVKDELGGITVRAEIQNICDHFGFMVDNPTAVLTQTASKKFLAEAKPIHHHELFRKATLLGPLQDELNETKKVADSIKLMLKQKEDMRPAVEQQITDLKITYEESKEMKNLGTRIKEHKKILLWSYADEEEHKLNVWREKVENEYEPDLTKHLQKEKKLEKSIAELTESVATEETVMQAGKAKAESARKVLTNATKQLAMCASSRKRKVEQIAAADESIQQAHVSIAKSKDELEDARNLHLGGQHSKAHIAADLQACNANIEQVQQQEEQAKVALSEAENNKSNQSRGIGFLEQKLNSIAQEHDSKRREAAQQRQHAMTTNSVARFGRQFAVMMPLIEKAVAENRFHYPPLGPVGQFMKVKDESWASTIQDAVHPATLTQFLVGDRHDMEQLRNIFRNSKCQPPKVVVINGGLGNKPRHNITPNDIPRVHELGHCTVLDQLEVSHDDIFNLLVDHCAIEGNVLVRGQDNMSAVSKNRNLRNVATCWDEHGNRAYERSRAWTFRATQRHRNAGSMLSSDREGYVRGLEEAALALEHDRRAADVEVRDAKRESSRLVAAEREAQRNLRGCRERLQKLMKEKASLEEKREEASSEFDPLPFEESITNFSNDLAESEREKATLEEELAKLVANMDDAKEAKKKAVQADKEARDELQSFMATVEDATKRIGKEKYLLRNVVKEKQRKQDIVEQAHREISEQQAKFLEKLENAKAVQPERPEMEHGKTSEKVESELASMKSRLAAEERKRDGKSADEIENEFLQAQAKHNTNNKLILRIKGYHKSLAKGLAVRKQDKRDLEKIIKKLVRSHFRFFLGRRGHSGSISWRSNEKGQQELVIRTKMGTHKTGDGGLHETKDLKSLSGGERSFTTLSFMLALAEVCQNPVRIMDEPDVFMDEASRSAAFKSLIEFCSTTLSDRQLIIVTPLTIPPGVIPTDNVKIQKLAPIKRGGAASRGQRNMLDYVDREGD